MSTKHPKTLLVIVAEAVLEKNLVRDARLRGAQGWTVSEVHGAGREGVREGAWEADRKARIVPRNRIDVGVSDVDVAVNGDRATVKFRQAYNSDNLNVTSRKTLEMVKSGNRWLILRESTGS